MGRKDATQKELKEIKDLGEVYKLYQMQLRKN